MAHTPPCKQGICFMAIPPHRENHRRNVQFHRLFPPLWQQLCYYKTIQVHKYKHTVMGYITWYRNVEALVRFNIHGAWAFLCCRDHDSRVMISGLHKQCQSVTHSKLNHIIYMERSWGRRSRRGVGCVPAGPGAACLPGEGDGHAAVGCPLPADHTTLIAVPLYVT